MRKIIRLLLMLLALTTLPSTVALADGTWHAFINNPNPADRLHLRAEPSTTSHSLGKYYNGAPITPIEERENWVRVRVGKGPACLEGWMQKKFLSMNSAEAMPVSAMPLYMSTQSMKLYLSPQTNAKIKRFRGGQSIYLMGFTDLWWHMVVLDHAGDGYSAFVPANSKQLKRLNVFPEKNEVYISNPDERDRLHLRETPSATARSLGKYYNGSVGELISFSDDGKWVRVDMYGRIGWMMRKYVMLDGEGQNPCKSGIPTVYVKAENATLYGVPTKNSSHDMELSNGTGMVVLGVIDQNWLHVMTNGKTGFVEWNQTTFTDR